MRAIALILSLAALGGCAQLMPAPAEPAPPVEPMAMEAPAESLATMPGALVYGWEGGRFEKFEGARWIEFRADGTYAEYSEIDNFHGQALLRDPRRDIYVRLPAGDGWAWWAARPEGPWTRLYNVAAYFGR